MKPTKEKTEPKKIAFSGIQPSGIIHIGNYLGSIKQWLEVQGHYDAIFSVVNLHAITIPKKPAELKAHTLNAAKTFLASGVDPEKSTIFVQSDVPEHAQLYWALGTITKLSELYLMTQFKDKSQGQGKEGALAGLLNYPVLMAADILLYNTTTVPVGEDQRQHVELARELARRFNEMFGKTFIVPQALIHKTGSRIMGLDNPNKKMSKSAANKNNYIALTDTPDDIAGKIKKAVTDSEGSIHYDIDRKPGVSNLLTILSLVTDTSIKDLEKSYKGQTTYAGLKTDLTHTLSDFILAFQKKYEGISDAEAKHYLRMGAEKAHAIANQKLEEVYERMGLLL
ncbi:MAG: tryptophan--tRNA ligase [Candidatus Paceibacterota bacterium]|jgi:tryptophanyl-tRNA synthetase